MLPRALAQRPQVTIHPPISGKLFREIAHGTRPDVPTPEDILTRIAHTIFIQVVVHTHHSIADSFTRCDGKQRLGDVHRISIDAQISHNVLHCLSLRPQHLRSELRIVVSPNTRQTSIGFCTIYLPKNGDIERTVIRRNQITVSRAFHCIRQRHRHLFTPRNHLHCEVNRLGSLIGFDSRRITFIRHTLYLYLIVMITQQTAGYAARSIISGLDIHTVVNQLTIVTSVIASNHQCRTVQFIRIRSNSRAFIGVYRAKNFSSSIICIVCVEVYRRFLNRIT